MRGLVSQRPFHDIWERLAGRPSICLCPGSGHVEESLSFGVGLCLTSPFYAFVCIALIFVGCGHEGSPFLKQDAASL
jgi:hypothetical protein